ncbi:MAG: 2-amino-4-hydroxy-6-hydroxymethyldihydropteridine diphosphokinase, partial [Aeromonas sp.]
MTEVFIAIGSNLADPLGQARRAIGALAMLPASRLLQASSFYSSCPMGPADQPDYVNAVAQLRTHLAP